MGPQETYGYEQQPAAAPTGDPGKKKRIIIVVGGFIAFLTIGIIVLMTLLSTPTIRPEVARVAAMHSELTRIAELGLDSNDARRATRILAANVKAVSTNNLAQITDWANSSFTNKFTKATLSSQENKDIDAVLETASQRNEYDEEFSGAMVALLTAINKEIGQSNSKFAPYEDLATIMEAATANNTALIESVPN